MVLINNLIAFLKNSSYSFDNDKQFAGHCDAFFKQLLFNNKQLSIKLYGHLANTSAGKPRYIEISDTDADILRTCQRYIEFIIKKKLSKNIITICNDKPRLSIKILKGVIFKTNTTDKLPKMYAPTNCDGLFTITLSKIYYFSQYSKPSIIITLNDIELINFSISTCFTIDNLYNENFKFIYDNYSSLFNENILIKKIIYDNVDKINVYIYDESVEMPTIDLVSPLDYEGYIYILKPSKPLVQGIKIKEDTIKVGRTYRNKESGIYQRYGKKTLLYMWIPIDLDADLVRIETNIKRFLKGRYISAGGSEWFKEENISKFLLDVICIISIYTTNNKDTKYGSDEDVFIW